MTNSRVSLTTWWFENHRSRDKCCHVSSTSAQTRVNIDFIWYRFTELLFLNIY